MAKIPDTVMWESETSTGEGGQAWIRRVTSKDKGKYGPGPFLMKELKNTNSAQAVSRFANEINAVRTLAIPGIPRVVDWNADPKQHGGFLYFVMDEAPEYEPLSKFIFSANSPFKGNARACLTFIARCCTILEAVHQHGIFHRDLKPANVLCRRSDLSPLIIDFGICQIENGESVTLTGEAVGTPRYMAPECDAGGSGKVGPQTDIYSLGKVLWAMAAGQEVFGRERAAFTNRSLAKILPDVPEVWHITDVLTQAVRSSPSNRFSQAAEMARFCNELLALRVGRHPPLEIVGDLCPACGAGFASIPQMQSGTFPVGQNIFQNTVRASSTLQCLRCGFICGWNRALLQAGRTARENLEPN